MANSSAPSRASTLRPLTRAHTEQQLIGLKRRLRSRFPQVKPSHIVESVAAAHGFNTYAALLSDIESPSHFPLAKPFNAQQFRQRLLSFDYPIQRDFSFGLQPKSPEPPEHYRAWLEELREQRSSERDSERIAQLQNLCAREFAKTFGLGQPTRGHDGQSATRWYAGVDSGACLPGWGELLNHRKGGGVDFPGSDHRVFFFKRLPLALGGHVEYQDAMVSMPYADASWLPSSLEQAQEYAGRIGWRFSVHPEWSWYAPGASTLVLYRRTTSHEDTLQAWSHSFKRWMVENAAPLKKSAGKTRRMVIADIVDCQHVPLDLKDFEDCRERYLKEYAGHLYYGDSMADVFERLMVAWAEAMSNAAIRET